MARDFWVMLAESSVKATSTGNSPHISHRANTAIIRPGAHVRVGEDN